MHKTIYLKPTEYFDYDHPSIALIAKEFCRKHDAKVDLAIELFNLVRDGYDYSANEFSLNKDYLRASYIVDRKSLWCLQKAVLLTTLGRVCGIPSRLLIATIKNHKASNSLIKHFGTNVYFPHAYGELFLNGKWIKAAPVFDKDTCKRVAIPLVEFDGVNDAILPNSGLYGEPFIDYIEDYGHFHDLPWDMIDKAFKKMYPGVGYLYTEML